MDKLRFTITSIVGLVIVTLVLSPAIVPIHFWLISVLLTTVIAWKLSRKSNQIISPYNETEDVENNDSEEMNQLKWTNLSEEGVSKILYEYHHKLVTHLHDEDSGVVLIIEIDPEVHFVQASGDRDSFVIDLHSANQYNNRDGYINSALLYMEHFPYISRLWFGEYFQYDLKPDYWLTEVSGIPFGLTGEMLEKGGRPYHGLIYGMTTRVYHIYNPGALWDLFKKFDIKNSEMLGYWVEKTPIKIDNNKIKSTIYKHNKKVLIVIGSWSNKNEKIELKIDWKKLGIKKEKARLRSPNIDGLQNYNSFEIDKTIFVIRGAQTLITLRPAMANARIVGFGAISKAADSTAPSIAKIPAGEDAIFPTLPPALIAEIGTSAKIHDGKKNPAAPIPKQARHPIPIERWITTRLGRLVPASIQIPEIIARLGA